MTDDGYSPVEALTDICETIEGHNQYSSIDNEGLEDLAVKSIEEGPDASFEVVGTDARLEIGYKEGQNRVIGWVPHSLGPAVGADYIPEDSFTDKLSRAQQQYAEDIDSEYVNPHGPDPIHFVSLNLPLDYDEEELVSALDQVAGATQAIEEMHQDLEEVVQNRLE